VGGALQGWHPLCGQLVGVVCQWLGWILGCQGSHGVQYWGYVQMEHVVGAALRWMKDLLVSLHKQQLV